MCLVLYIGTARDQPTFSTPDLGVEAVEERRARVLQWFSLPAVRLVRAHGTCGCGFPHFLADEPVRYEEWLAPVLAQADDREADLRSVRALLALVGAHLRDSNLVELYPVADGSEEARPRGVVELSLGGLEPERFSFTEQFFYRVSR